MVFRWKGKLQRMNNKYKILLIEDDVGIARFVKTLLNANGYQVLCEDCVEGGLTSFSSHLPDLVVLDLGLPGKDGLEFLKSIRKDNTTPVIVLSARSEETDKVNALDLGANDYVTKPFGSAEFLARIRNILRNHRRGSQQGVLPGRKFVAGDLTIDYEVRRLYIGSNEIKLTQTEFNIMALLSEHFGKVLTYSAIINAVWGVVDSGSIKKLQVNMANIRRKLSLKPGESKYVHNELGVGYRMCNDAD